MAMNQSDHAEALAAALRAVLPYAECEADYRRVQATDADEKAEAEECTAAVRTAEATLAAWDAA